MSGGISKVAEAALGKDDDRVSFGEVPKVHLRLDVLLADSGIRGQAVHVDLIVEVPDVANDGLVSHPHHVFHQNDPTIAGGRHKDMAFFNNVFQPDDLVTFHAGLKSTDGVDLGNKHAGTLAPHGLGAPLAHLAEAADHHGLTSDHHVGGAADGVGQAVPTTINVVELTLGDTVVYIDRREEEGTGLLPLIQTIDSRGRFLAYAHNLGDHLVPILGVFLQLVPQELLNDPHLPVLGCSGVRKRSILGETILGFITQMHEQRGVAAVVHDKRGTTFGEIQRPVGAPPVILEALAFPRKDRDAPLGHGRGGMILGGKDVAAGPAHVGPQVDQRFNEYRRLYGHVERPGNPGSRQRPGRLMLPTDGH